jgi:hypothetical protein
MANPAITVESWALDRALRRWWFSHPEDDQTPLPQLAAHKRDQIVTMTLEIQKVEKLRDGPEPQEEAEAIEQAQRKLGFHKSWPLNRLAFMESIKWEKKRLLEQASALGKQL